MTVSVGMGRIVDNYSLAALSSVLVMYMYIQTSGDMSTEISKLLC